MNRKVTILLLILAVFCSGLVHAERTDSFAVGVVYEDINKNGVRDPGEPGIKGVRVSNGAQITKTDSRGAYKLAIDDDTIIFVIKPRNWTTAFDENNIPRFYYIHKPAGSPEMHYEGVKPTGKLPDSVDFPLYRQREPNKYKAIFMGDPQVRSVGEVNYMAHDVVEELVDTDALFCATLGDIVYDNLAMFEHILPVMGQIGIPSYYVKGNHDTNYDMAGNQKLVDETWERWLGPSYYSFDYGKVHFIVLNNPDFSKSRNYGAALDPTQMEFLRNDLALVPKKQLVVLMMHIPLNTMSDRKEIFELLKDRPNTLSLAAHTHTQDYRIMSEYHGWDSPHLHLHLVNGATCGSWWSGALDEVGIPHTTMRDGAPNGYSIITFDGSKFSVRFKAARKPDDYQMNIYAPDQIKATDSATTEVLVNVFAGSPLSEVRMQLGSDGKWQEMEKKVLPDPAYVQTKEREDKSKPRIGHALAAAGNCTHLWSGNLPSSVAPGTYLINIETTDMFKQTFRASRVININ